MKKSLAIILLLAFAACSPGFSSYPSNTPAVMKTAETSTVLPQATQTVHSLITAVSTEIAMATSTALPRPISTRVAYDVVERAYDPSEWKLLYDKDTVWKVELDSTGKMWVWLARGEVGFFDGNQWILFSAKDYLLPGNPFDMATGPDGAVWLAGRYEISRYQHGQWKVFTMPGVNGAIFPHLTIDSSGTVWVAMTDCSNCGNSLSKFDGKNWSDLWLWTTERTLRIPQILFTPDGTLWAADNGGEIGRYDGKTWKSYSEMDLWSKDDYATTIRIASDDKGNIFGVYSGQYWISKIDNTGNISKIPFDPSKLNIDPTRLRLFIDRQETVWINACLKDKQNSCLAYHKDNQWISFINLPFTMVDDIKELPDGTLLFATWQGLFQFKSAK